VERGAWRGARGEGRAGEKKISKIQNHPRNLRILKEIGFSLLSRVFRTQNVLLFQAEPGGGGGGSAFPEGSNAGTWRTFIMAFQYLIFYL
jgi:hypothetical protein